MKASKWPHHEAVSAEIVRKSAEIREIVVKECGDEKAIDQICAMIVGDGETEGIDKAMVQILHAEIDADGIDYMLRDALFSGTSFGSFEIDMLINHMEKREVDGEQIIYIRRKGIPAADQYLINKYFSFAQVTFNKRVAIYEWMATNIVAWMQQASAYFPNDETLLKNWLKTDNITTDFLRFDDNFFWKALRDMVENPLACFAQETIVNFCKLLLSHKGLKMIEGTEIRFESDNVEEAKCRLQTESFYANLTGEGVETVTLFSSIGFTKHISQEEFELELKREAEKTLENDKGDPEYSEQESMHLIEEAQKKQRLRRLMDGTVTESVDGELVLLCDDEGSLMHYLHKVKLYIIRQYELRDLPR